MAMIGMFTYHITRREPEHFWEFSLIPPLHRNNMNIQGTVLVFRATRDHYNIVRGFHTSYLKDTGKTCSSRLADVCCFQPEWP